MTTMIKTGKGGFMNPYKQIRKVPLSTSDGVFSSAWSVQLESSKKKDNGWKEVGTVGRNYLLLPNQKVKEIADDIAEQCDIKFFEDRTFFNGKSYMYSLKSDNVIGEIEKGDDVALGLQFWNSYDGSRSFGWSLIMYRLVCTNGMMSKESFGTYRFKHEPQSENWEEDLEIMVNNINKASAGESYGVRNLIDNLKTLKKTEIDINLLGQIRHNYLDKIPTSLWGNIVDKFTGEDYKTNNGWDLLNASTDILWHREKPTVANYDQNSMIVDGLCNAIAS